MEEIQIMAATVHDLDRLRAIGIQTFTETFAAINTAENMRKYLAESFSMEKLAAELNDKNAFFFLAVVGDVPVGYLKLNTGASQTELKEERGMEIERIYVSKAFHGKKVGQLLYDKAIETAGAGNLEYVWLGVWEKNFRAIRFYEKNGFRPFDKHMFYLGDDAQTDIMMKLVL
ncbi:MAG: GNAT family N-acetyltransferase [Flavihumibacter sp.]